MFQQMEEMEFFRTLSPQIKDQCKEEISKYWHTLIQLFGFPIASVVQAIADYLRETGTFRDRVIAEPMLCAVFYD